jgi:hypothetical protein
MYNRLRAYMQLVLGRKPAGRLLTVFPDDIFLVGYFRSGTTWSRFLFGSYIHQEHPVTFATLDHLYRAVVPDHGMGMFLTLVASYSFH